MARAKTGRTNDPKPTKTGNADLTLVPDVRKNVTPINVEDEIRRRAYELYEQRGYVSGHDHEDWLLAEREVLARYHHQQSA